jgi:speckle-type POZ protein
VFAVFINWCRSVKTEMASKQEVGERSVCLPNPPSEQWGIQIVPSISVAPRSYWCQSKAEVDEVDFKWMIERFMFYHDAEQKNRLSFTSTEFDNRFSLNLTFEKDDIIINLLSSTILANSIRVEIAIISETCQKIGERTKCIRANAEFPVRVYEISKQDLQKSVNLASGDITIYCKIGSLKRKHQSGISTATDRNLDMTLNDSNQDLILHQLEEMFEKMPLSDVTFNIGGRKIAAHKNILAMRSPVLAAMFHHPTKEVQSRNVKVEDIDPDVFQEVLRFIYTGKTQPTAMNKMASGLLAAADKYRLADLKSRCETHLIRQMSAENCLELLSVTTNHPAEHLKKYAIEHFRRYPGKSRL